MRTFLRYSENFYRKDVDVNASVFRNLLKYNSKSIDGQS